MSVPNPDTDNETIKATLFPAPLTTYSASSRAIMNQTKRPNAHAFRSQVDQRIAELENEIRALKSHRNTVADTCILPAEVLSNIFIALKEVIVHERKMSWVRVSHVCRHWRAVALDCPVLWSTILSVNPELMELMLHRSKSSPLTIKISACTTRTNDVLSKTLSQTSRLRDVELHLGEWDTSLEASKILSNFDKAAPILEKLVLEGTKAGHSLIMSDQQHAIWSIPNDFLQEGAPSLEHLDITRSAFHWDVLPISSTLTYLRLENVAPENRPIQKSFYKSMAKMSQLETLELAACLPLSNDALKPGSLSITLRSLRTLKLQDTASQLCQFFHTTQIPEDAKVDIKLDERNPTSETLAPVFSALKESWVLSKDTVMDADGSSGRFELLDLRILPTKRAGDDNRVSTGGAPRIMCWFKDQDLPPTLDAENPPAKLVVSLKDPGYRSALLVTAIAEQLEFLSLRSLKIASEQPLSDETLGMFGNLAQLEHLAIWHDLRTLSSFLWVFDTDDDDDDSTVSDSSESPSFPALRTINLRYIDFNMYVLDPDVLGTFCTALKRRKDSLGSPIEELAINQCSNFEERQWQRLCSALPEEARMVWDYHEDIQGREGYGFEYYRY